MRLPGVWRGWHCASEALRAPQTVAGRTGKAKCHPYAPRPSEGLLCYSCGGTAEANTVRMR